MPRTRTVLLVAMVAAIAGASASLFFEPRVAQRLAGTAAGQRLLDAALKAKADPPPAGVIVGERGRINPSIPKACQPPRLMVCAAKAPPFIFSGFPVGFVE